MIYEELVADLPTISRATVYRNLNVLADNGLIRRVRIPNSPDRFDHTVENHFHIHCTQCGAVSDVSLTVGEDVSSFLMSGDSHGYEIQGYELVFNGLCPDCKKKK